MNEEKWEVIKFKFEQTLKSWELDKKTNQFTVDSIHSLFPTEIEVIVNYIEDLQKQNAELKEENQKFRDKKYEILNFIKTNKNKTIAPYGDNEDYDYEICLNEDDITTLERIINNEYDYES